MAKKRLNRYWTSNEKQVMRKLGLRPVPGSGSGELLKEDGENDFVICQLKSTEATSIKISRIDVEKLLYHAELDNKIPIFAIQFMNGPMLLATVPEELGNISKYLNEDIYERKSIELVEIPKQKKKKAINASSKSIDEIIQDAKVNINVSKEVSEEFELPAIAKRKQRNEMKKEQNAVWNIRKNR